jgi:GAF domain-containing protein|tara:strand:- start:83 stop:547 length:465 start_codon:yes stop_codon:yes gene_type:complete
LPEADKAAIALCLAVNEAVKVLGAKAAYIRLLVDGVLTPGAATASAAQYLDDIAGLSTLALLSAGKTAAGQLIATKVPLVLDDVTESDLILAQTRQIAASHGFHGTAAVPLLAEDQVVGVFFVFAGRVRHFTDQEVSTLSSLAKQAVLALPTNP